ncbi:helicase-associated domain-containing protein [Knoellia subterranea]|uniref:DNA-binding protein n=1 Tax=Knoellia subterranea KCTC 19937 TaxID=1385521 RepID=A0A0A0JKR3_9MICO|nr:helicase-associated domain-containing protein [Knoellia subterranea]KGN36642.1 DNA-binding protein [Knoellia subterranea KCTC 19937]
MVPEPSPPNRSLADDIRARSDEELTSLVAARPDLARPAPSDLTALASRSATRASTARAIDALDAAHLQALEAAAVATDPVTPATLARLLGASDESAAAGLLDDLWRVGLVWRSPHGLVVTRTVIDVLGDNPAGLGLPAEDLPGPPAADEATLQSEIAAAPPRARAILDRLTWGPAVGIVGPDDAPGRRGPAEDGARWLLAHGLVRAVAADQVALPREVAMVLRGGRVHADSQLMPPAPAGVAVDPDRVDAAAGAAASEVLALLDELLDAWSQDPPRVLRTGGLSVRDLKAASTRLDTEPEHTAYLVELALIADLVADDGEVEPHWVPTAEYDQWQTEPGGERWARLALAWLSSTRAPHRVGGRTDASTVINALGPDAQWPPIRSLRRAVLDLLDRHWATAPEPAAVAESVRWARPRRVPRTLDSVVGAVLREAAWLGVTGHRALSSAGRAVLLAEGDPRAAAESIHPHLPAPVDAVLLQADLTAIAPGPVTGSLAAFLRLVADVESRGGATVHRFSDESIRRCLDQGWTGDDILAGLRDASSTPVPQPLEYLVRDVARRHGTIRVRGVSAVIRSEDERGLEVMLAHRRLAPLQLRRIAPTVLTSPVSPEVVLEMLREEGFAPVPESASGVVAVPIRPARRAVRSRSVDPALVQAMDRAQLGSLIQTLRAGEDEARNRASAIAGGRGPAIPANDPTTSIAVLREAIADGRAVWLGYSDSIGQTQRLLFHPERIDGGRVSGVAEDVARTLSIHRITGVVPD